MRIKVIWIIVTVMALALTFAIFSSPTNVGRDYGEKRIVTDSIVYDTVRYNMPVPYDSVVVRYEVEKLPVKTIYETRTDTVVERIVDSVEVVIPISKTTYQDSTYKAVVSGYLTSLDDIEVYPKTVYRTTTVTQKPKKFGFGIQAGYGADKHGLSPYIGIGVQYNIFSW